MRDEKGTHLFDWEMQVCFVHFLHPPLLFDLFHLRLARSHLSWLKKGLSPCVENEEGPSIFLSTVLLEAPLSP